MWRPDLIVMGDEATLTVGVHPLCGMTYLLKSLLEFLDHALLNDLLGIRIVSIHLTNLSVKSQIRQPLASRKCE